MDIAYHYLENNITKGTDLPYDMMRLVVTRWRILLLSSTTF